MRYDHVVAAVSLLLLVATVCHGVIVRDNVYPQPVRYMHNEDYHIINCTFYDYVMFQHLTHRHVVISQSTFYAGFVLDANVVDFDNTTFLIEDANFTAKHDATTAVSPLTIDARGGDLRFEFVNCAFNGTASTRAVLTMKEHMYIERMMSVTIRDSSIFLPEVVTYSAMPYTIVTLANNTFERQRDPSLGKDRATARQLVLQCNGYSRPTSADPLGDDFYDKDWIGVVTTLPCNTSNASDGPPFSPSRHSVSATESLVGPIPSTTLPLPPSPPTEISTTTTIARPPPHRLHTATATAQRLQLDTLTQTQTVTERPQRIFVSHSETLATVPPVEAPVVLVANDVKTAVESTGTAMAVVAIASGPTVAVVAARASAIRRLYDCSRDVNLAVRGEEFSTLGTAEYPLQVSLAPSGSADAALGKHFGAATLNLVLFVAAVAVAFAAHLAEREPLVQVFGRLATALGYLLVQPSFRSITLVVLEATSAPWRAIAAVCGALWVACGVATMVLIFRAGATFFHDAPDDVSRPLLAAVGSWHVGSGHAIAAEADAQQYHNRLGRVHWSHRLRWFCAIEWCVSGVSGSLSGVVPGTTGGCRALTVATAVLYVLHFAVVVALRPETRPLVQWATAVIGALVIVMALGAVASQATSGVTKDAATVLAFSSMSVTALSTLLQVALVVDAIMRFLERRQNATGFEGTSSSNATLCGGGGFNPLLGSDFVGSSGDTTVATGGGDGYRPPPGDDWEAEEMESLHSSGASE